MRARVCVCVCVCLREREIDSKVLHQDDLRVRDGEDISRIREHNNGHKAKSKSFIRPAPAAANTAPVMSSASFSMSPRSRPMDVTPSRIDDAQAGDSSSTPPPSQDPLAALGISRAAAGFLGLVDDSSSSHSVVRAPPLPTSPTIESHHSRRTAGSTSASRPSPNMRAPSPSILQSSTSTLLGTAVPMYGLHLKESQVCACPVFFQF